ncbi:hypothetical protein LINPERHAP2_LOCUS30336 [Linum perenne]
MVDQLMFGTPLGFVQMRIFFVQTLCDEGLRGLQVCDLFIPGLREWDVEMIQMLFHERDAAAIIGIPIMTNAGSDRRVWHFSRKGGYTVRSGYRLIMDRSLRLFACSWPVE